MSSFKSLRLKIKVCYISLNKQEHFKVLLTVLLANLINKSIVGIMLLILFLVIFLLVVNHILNFIMKKKIVCFSINFVLKIITYKKCSFFSTLKTQSLKSL